MIIRPEAEQDLFHAAQWYEEQQTVLGIRFRAAVNQVLQQIEATPELYRIVQHRTRRALTKRFPFAVYYRVEEDQVVVQAVMHLHRDSDSWKTRESL